MPFQQRKDSADVELGAGDVTDRLKRVDFILNRSLQVLQSYVRLEYSKAKS